MTLRDRALKVLGELIDIHTKSGQPVGSKALAELECLNVSSATIRSIMSDLEKEGLLISPHTSAGRIPTEEGYRIYTQGVLEVSEPSKKLKSELDEISIQSKGDMDALIKAASNKLGEMTACTGLVLAPKKTDEPLDELQFMRLSSGNVLAILVYNEGHIENRLMQVPDEITKEQLKGAATNLTELVKGQTLNQARKLIINSLKEEKQEFDNYMAQQVFDLEELEDEVPEGKELVVAGSQNLFGYPELVRDKLKNLFHVFEEKKLLIGLLDEVKKGPGVQIFIGADCPIEGADDCAMITANYTNADGQIGTLAVIGPMRMDYQQNVALVDYTAKVLSQVLTKEN